MKTMFSHHPAARALARLGAFSTPTVVLDSAAADAKAVLDAATLDNASSFVLNDIRLAAVASVQEWLATTPEDLGEGETLAARLIALMVGIADSNKDGEISDDEANLIEIAMGTAWDYLVSCGATEDDVSLLLNDEDDEAAQRVAEFVKLEVPAGDEGLAAIDAFVFDAEASESVFDSAGMVLDAVYRKKMVVRAGKKVRINKRISGTVRLSAAQKVAIRKAHLKSNNAAARMSRMKSVRARARMGLNKR